MSSHDGAETNDGGSPKKGLGSRYNAVTHGLTAKTAVFPGEDAEAYQAKVDGYKASVAARNHIENDLAEIAAMDYWRIQRAARSEAARAEHALQTETAAAELADRKKSAALGNRLLFDRRGPIELYGMEEYDYQEPRTSWSNVADDPDAPSKLVMDLEASLAGVGWLLEALGRARRSDRLRFMLEHLNTNSPRSDYWASNQSMR